MKVNKNIKVYSAFATVLAIALIVIFVFSAHLTSTSTTFAPNSIQAQSFSAQFDVLSHATTDQCAYLGNLAAIESSVNSQPANAYFQGSCCSPMNFNHYIQQRTDLKAYANISAIPQDPYNVSVGKVKQMLGWYNNITLNQSQQAVFDQAATLTTDKSWCCCQCWAWYAHAGLAKYLIKNYNFNMTEIVTITNLEDCCGG
ncbi:MAG: hypothetical protein JJ59_01320 [Candidatus Micrarchaeum sp. AZ1]|jgi:hypothetical protein|nr:MAG: hypothetical protein JJ59_01320 [Candidatus Micrarchaeum sp. AZ1]